MPRQMGPGGRAVTESQSEWLSALLPDPPFTRRARVVQQVELLPSGAHCRPPAEDLRQLPVGELQRWDSAGFFYGSVTPSGR